MHTIEGKEEKDKHIHMHRPWSIYKFKLELVALITLTTLKLLINLITQYYLCYPYYLLVHNGIGKRDDCRSQSEPARDAKQR